MNIERLCELKGNREIMRMGKLFYTTRSSYLYDTGTGKVVKLDSNSKKVMEALFNENMNVDQFKSVYQTVLERAAACLEM